MPIVCVMGEWSHQCIVVHFHPWKKHTDCKRKNAMVYRVIENLMPFRNERKGLKDLILQRGLKGLILQRGRVEGKGEKWGKTKEPEMTFICTRHTDVHGYSHAHTLCIIDTRHTKHHSAQIGRDKSVGFSSEISPKI